jgi:hypothetical protein
MTNLLITGDDVIWVTWKYMEEEETIPILRNTKGSYGTTGTLSNSTRIWTR